MHNKKSNFIRRMEKVDLSLRKIIHIDMDAFYASVEQMDNPDLKGKPLAVGGSRERGVVAAASYEARAFGVHSALASSIAVRRCPDLVFVRPRFDRYKEVSNHIMEIFYRYTALVEPLSMDEAYLDVTQNKKGIKSAIKVAMLIRADIKREVGLTASAGVSFNKFLAKTASDLDKPDGLSVILEEQAQAFMEQLPIEKFHGIGKVTAKKMNEMGIHKGSDLMKLERRELIQHFGKAGKHYFNIIHAEDHRAVNPNRIRKSIGAERTFSDDLVAMDELEIQLQKIHEVLMERISRSGKKGKTITLKIKYFDFEQKSRSRSFAEYTNDAEKIWQRSKELLNQSDLPEKNIRLLGLTLSNLEVKVPVTKGQLSFQFKA